jgi:SAM-dependent methyltransferase
MSANQPVELSFSRKYDTRHAHRYLRKHHDGLARRLSHWRDEQVARKALKMAGEPGLVLDLPCGAGRFWSVLAENPNRRILAADNSAAMLNTARQSQVPAIVSRVESFQTSAFSIDLDANAVDGIFCIRLLHHVQQPAHRLALLREFHRVTRDTVIFSLWVDGNYKAWRRRALEAKRERAGKPGQNQNRFVVSREEIEREIVATGFEIVGKIDFIPGYAMWRTYVVRKKG